MPLMTVFPKIPRFNSASTEPFNVMVCDGLEEMEPTKLEKAACASEKTARGEDGKEVFKVEPLTEAAAKGVSMFPSCLAPSY